MSIRQLAAGRSVAADEAGSRRRLAWASWHASDSRRSSPRSLQRDGLVLSATHGQARLIEVFQQLLEVPRRHRDALVQLDPASPVVRRPLLAGDGIGHGDREANGPVAVQVDGVPEPGAVPCRLAACPGRSAREPGHLTPHDTVDTHRRSRRVDSDRARWPRPAAAPSRPGFAAPAPERGTARRSRRARGGAASSILGLRKVWATSPRWRRTTAERAGRRG